MSKSDKPRITKHGMLWKCYRPLHSGVGFGLTPADAYRSWLLDSQRPNFNPLPPRLVPMHEPVVPWPVYQPPVFAPTPATDPWWEPPYTVTCWQ